MISIKLSLQQRHCPPTATLSSECTETLHCPVSLLPCLMSPRHPITHALCQLFMNAYVGTRAAYEAKSEGYVPACVSV